MFRLEPELLVYNAHRHVADVYFAGYLGYAVLLGIFYAASEKQFGYLGAIRTLGGCQRAEVGVALSREKVAVERHPQPAFNLPRLRVLSHEHALAVALQRLLEFLAMHVGIDHRVVRER